MLEFKMIAGSMPVGNVVLLGIGIVFVGLICIVVLCSLMGGVMRLLTGKKEAPVAASAPAKTAPAPVVAAIPNRGELVAAIACAAAEELGTDVQAIRIVSLKKI